MIPQSRLYLLAALFLVLASTAGADSRSMIQDSASQVLGQLRERDPGAGQLLDTAVGILIFPDVVEMGFGDGGEYGEGVLQVDSAPVAYYVTAGSAPPGGSHTDAAYRAELILFMTDEALQAFHARRSWEVGVHGQVNMVRATSGGGLDGASIAGPVLGLVLSDTGLSYNLDLEGNTITRVKR